MLLEKDFMVFLKKDETLNFLTFRIFENPQIKWENINLFDIIAKSSGVEIVRFTKDELRKFVPEFCNDVASGQRYEEIPNNRYFKECLNCCHNDCLNQCYNFNRILYFRNEEN